MATEVSTTEHTVEVVAEETKATENIVTGGESSTQSKDLEGEDIEHRVDEVDLGAVKASVAESEKVIEIDKCVVVAEDLKASTSEILAHVAEEIGEIIKQKSDNVSVESAMEVHEKELKNHLDIASIPEPHAEERTISAECSEISSVKLSESEIAKDQAVSAMPEEENPKESDIAEEPTILAISNEENPKELEATEKSAISTVSDEESPKESEAAQEAVISAVPEDEQQKVSEVVEDPKISEAVSEKDQLADIEKPAETTVTSSASETEEKSQQTVAPTDADPEISATTTPDDSGSAEILEVEKVSTEEDHETMPESTKEEPPVTDSSNEEISDKLPEVGEETLTSQVVSGLSEERDSHENVFGEESVKEENVSVHTDTSPVFGVVEGPGNPEDKVEEETQEKFEVIKEPTLTEMPQTGHAAEVTQVSSEGSGGVEKVKEEKDETLEAVETSESLNVSTEVCQVGGEKSSGGVEVADEKKDHTEGDKTTLVETAGDLDMEEGKVKETEVPSKTENITESAKGAGDTLTEVPAKTPQRNIFSKVKHSMVKIKKAIIGKSPNPKTTTSEGNDDVKVK